MPRFVKKRRCGILQNENDKVNNANFCSESSSSIHFPALPPILFSHLVLDPNPAFARYFFRKDPVSSSFQNLISVLQELFFPKSFLENFS